MVFAKTYFECRGRPRPPRFYSGRPRTYALLFESVLLRSGLPVGSDPEDGGNDVWFDVQPNEIALSQVAKHRLSLLDRDSHALSKLLGRFGAFIVQNSEGLEALGGGEMDLLRGLVSVSVIGQSVDPDQKADEEADVSKREENRKCDGH